MDYACPHCHELMRTDPASGQPPPMCPRCGGDSVVGATQAVPQEPAAGSTAGSAPAARSLATFLQTPAPKTGLGADESAQRAEDARESPTEGAGLNPQAHTLQADPIGVADADAGSEPGLPANAPDAPAASAPPAGPGQHDAAAHDPSPDSTPMTAATGIASTSAEAVSNQGEASAAAASAAPGSSTRHEAITTPSFTRPARDSALQSRVAPWQWAALALLALALALQVVLADRARLAADAQWRPLLTSLCGVFGCTLPDWHEPGAFTMLSRDVRPAPGTSGALLVQATFRNDARWSQAWPVMRLALSDADGRTVGARAFVPSEYLDATTTQTALAPGQSAQIMLQVREPETSVVAFSFQFD